MKRILKFIFAPFLWLLRKIKKGTKGFLFYFILLILIFNTKFLLTYIFVQGSKALGIDTDYYAQKVNEKYYKVKNTYQDLVDYFSSTDIIVQSNDSNKKGFFMSVPARYKAQTTQDVIDAIKRKSQEIGLREVLFQSVGKVESAYRPMASRFEPAYFDCYLMGKGSRKNSKGEVTPCSKLIIRSWPSYWADELKDISGKMRAATSYGIMQVMPASAYRVAKKYNVEYLIPHIHSLFDIEVNLTIGGLILADCVNASRGSYARLAQCYNGPKTTNWKDLVADIMINELILKPIPIDSNHFDYTIQECDQNIRRLEAELEKQYTPQTASEIRFFERYKIMLQEQAPVQDVEVNTNDKEVSDVSNSNEKE